MSSATGEDWQVPSHHVICGGAITSGAERENVIRLDVSKYAAAGTRLELKLEDLLRPLADNIPPVMVDALEIGAYVYSADRLIRRGSQLMMNMGAEWRRDLHFTIPVRCVDIWRRTDVHSALVEALSFVSEDTFTFEFIEGRDAAGIQPYLGYSDPDAQKIAPDEVLLFSGGLDSLAGAVTELVGNGKKLVLVSHQSSTQIANHQKSLVQSLRERTTPGQFDHIGVWVGRGSAEPVEYTQRTRSFLFATLGVTIASMYGLDTLHVSENGVTTFNLPISEHVIGSRASRTTHPRTLAQFSSLFSLLLERQVSIQNRYIWSTKAEVVQAIAASGCADLIGQTTSCAGVRNLAMTGRHCGVCSQCIERRFAILAAGLERHDSEGGYVIDPFSGEHSNAVDLAMVEQYVLRARNLATMTQEAFLANYGQVFRALPFLPGSPDQNAHRIHRLHQRHGAAVVAVLNGQLAASANLNTILDGLPKTSLLAMIQSATTMDFHHSSLIENEPRPSVQAAQTDKAVADRQFKMGVDGHKKKIAFADGPTVSGRGYELIAWLAERHREDLENGGTDFRFIRADALAREFGISEEALRKRIHRLRADIAKQFSDCYGYTPDEDDIIENAAWHGYRLNPYVLLMSVIQLGLGDRKSRNSSRDVTTHTPAA